MVDLCHASLSTATLWKLMHERARDILLGAWGRAVAARPRTTLAICLALAAGGLWLAQTRLQFKSDRSELVDPGLEWNRQFLQFKASYPSWSDVVIVLDGEAGDRRVDEVARTIASTLDGHEGIH